MNRGARLLIEEVPLSAEGEAEPVSPADEDAISRLDFLVNFLLGRLVAGVLLAMGGSVLSLLG